MQGRSARAGGGQELAANTCNFISRRSERERNRDWYSHLILTKVSCTTTVPIFYICMLSTRYFVPTAREKKAGSYEKKKRVYIRSTHM